MNHSYTTRFLSATLACAVSLVMALTAHAFEKGGIAYRVIDGTNTVKVIRNNSNTYPADVNIPEQVTYGGKTFTVVAIASGAFAGERGGHNFYIPKTVKSIGEELHTGAWEGSECWKVEFDPECTIKEIPFACFKKSQLDGIDIPASVTDIRRDAFSGCMFLSYIVIPPTVQTIWEGAFGGCYSNVRGHIYQDPLEIHIKDGPNTLHINGDINSRHLTLNIGRRYTLEGRDRGTGFSRVEDVTFYGHGSPNDYYSTGFEKKITIKRRVYPSAITGGSFNYVDKMKCELHVPRDIVPLYEQNSFWSTFHNIIGF